MTRRTKILVGVVLLVVAGLAGSAIAQATSSRAPRPQQAVPAQPSAALHSKVRAARTAKVKESPSTSGHAQKALDDTQAENEQPGVVEPKAANDDSTEANDDDLAAGNEQAGDDDQGEQEHATADSQADDSQHADVEDGTDHSSAQANDNKDDSSGESNDDEHQDGD